MGMSDEEEAVYQDLKKLKDSLKEGENPKSFSLATS